MTNNNQRGIAFQNAAEKGDLESVTTLLEDDRTLPPAERISAGHWGGALAKVAKKGHTAIFTALQEYDDGKFSEDQSAYFREQALLDAVSHGHAAIVTTLLKYNRTLPTAAKRISAQYRGSALVNAANYGDTAIVTTLLEHDRTLPEAKRISAQHRESALVGAATHKSRQILLYMLASEAEAERVPMLRKACPEMADATRDAILSATIEFHKLQFVPGKTAEQIFDKMEHVQRLGALQRMDKLFSHVESSNCAANKLPPEAETLILSALTGDKHQAENVALTKKWAEFVAMKKTSSTLSR